MNGSLIEHTPIGRTSYWQLTVDVILLVRIEEIGAEEGGDE